MWPVMGRGRSRDVVGDGFELLLAGLELQEGGFLCHITMLVSGCTFLMLALVNIVGFVSGHDHCTH